MEKVDIYPKWNWWNLYVDPNKYNNEYVIQFKELEQLSSRLSASISYNGSNSQFNWVGEKAALLLLLAMVVGIERDCKLSVMAYKDSSQSVYYDENETLSIHGLEILQERKQLIIQDKFQKTDENLEKLAFDSGLRLLSGLVFNVGDKVIGKIGSFTNDVGTKTRYDGFKFQEQNYMVK